MRRFRLSLRFCILAAAVLTVACAVNTRALADTSSADGPHVHVQLAIPQDQLYPGGANAAGLYFKLEPGWHVYWKNAGDSGEPPHIQWTLPQGITAGPMQFPAPKRLPLGPLMDFGYENEVLFPFTFDGCADGESRPGRCWTRRWIGWCAARFAFPARRNWKPRCSYPAAKPPVEIRIGSRCGAFKRLAATLPKPLPAGDKAVFQPTPDGFRLAVETGQRETQAEFFPEDEDILDNPRRKS